MHAVSITLTARESLEREATKRDEMKGQPIRIGLLLCIELVERRRASPRGNTDTRHLRCYNIPQEYIHSNDMRLATAKIADGCHFYLFLFLILFNKMTAMSQ